MKEKKSRTNGESRAMTTAKNQGLLAKAKE